MDTKKDWRISEGASEREGINDVVYRYSDDMLDEFMRLEPVVAQMKRKQKEAETDQAGKVEKRSMNWRTG